MLTDFRKLRHVIGVADAQSFTGASVTLGITQSALTKSIAEVEHLLSIKLFQRLARGVKLTEAGELFVERARRILADAEDLMSGIDKFRDLREGRLRIGVGPAAFTPLIEDALAAFASVYPGIRIEVMDSDLQEVARALATGQVDVVLGEASYLGRWSELQTETVATLHDCFIARPEHPARGVVDLAPDDLMAYPVVVPSDRLPTDDELASVYARMGMTPKEPQYRCNSMNLLRKLVLATNAIAPLVTFRGPNAALKRDFWVIEDLVELRQHSLGMALPKQREQIPAVLAFCDIFRSFRAGGLPGSASVTAFEHR